jgi:hypothetical protein
VLDRTVGLMRCVECGRLKGLDERGWVTVLSPSGERRIHYCCDCMEDLIGRASTADQVDDYPEDE